MSALSCMSALWLYFLLHWKLLSSGQIPFVCKHTCNKVLLILSSCPSLFGFLLNGSQTSFDSMSDDCLRYKKCSYQEYIKTQTCIKHTQVVFYGLRGLYIGIMFFILYTLYVLLPYTYPTPKLSPHRRPPPPPKKKKTHSMIYKRFELWGQ